MQKKTVYLPGGGALELECDERFFDVVREHFKKAPGEFVSDEEIRIYIYGALDSALNKSSVREIETAKAGRSEDPSGSDS